MTRKTVSIAVLGLIVLVVLVLAPSVFFVIFAGVLFGILLSSGGEAISSRSRLSRGWGIAAFTLGLLVILVGAGFGFAPAVLEQADTLAREIPGAVEQVRMRIEAQDWLEGLLRRAAPGGLSGGEAATAAVSSTFGTLGNMVIVLFIGLYGAANPDTYRAGVRAVLAPSIRPRADEVMDKSTSTLRSWIGAQLISMTIVGTLTWLGLWAVGVPLALLLGLIAGLLAFIPNIGPIVAALPAVLLASLEGSTTVLLVIGVYVIVQMLETYAITPFLQKERVSLPPALVIGMQLLMGVLFGIAGLIFASPLAALGMTLVNALYRHDYLEREPRPTRQPQPG